MMCEPREACAIEVHCERLVRHAQRVDSHVELLPTNQQRIADVFLHDIWIGLLTKTIAVSSI